MADVNWSYGARQDLKAIAAYFESTSFEYAKYIIDKLYYAVSHLEAYPKIGREVPELDLGSFREIIIEQYRVIYLVETFAMLPRPATGFVVGRVYSVLAYPPDDKCSRPTGYTKLPWYRKLR